jgi:hypothetical protein
MYPNPAATQSFLNIENTSSERTQMFRVSKQCLASDVIILMQKYKNYEEEKVLQMQTSPH